MSETRCERTDLEVTMCSHCRGLDAREVETHTIDLTIRAKYDGKCAACYGRIDADDLIHRTTDGIWICESCGDA